MKPQQRRASRVTLASPIQFVPLRLANGGATTAIIKAQFRCVCVVGFFFSYSLRVCFPTLNGSSKNDTL